LAIAALIVVLGETGGSGAVRSRRTQKHGSAALGQAGGEHRFRYVLSRTDAIGNARIERLARLGLPIYCAGKRGNELAFTFDDGPGPFTRLAIKKLRAAGERATFFVVGRNIPRYPGFLRRELKVAAIGDHTYTHPELIALPPDEVSWELRSTARSIEANSGQRVDLWRPPYELHDAMTDRIARRLGLLEILWNVDSADSRGANWAQIINKVKARLRPGDIILMHENRGQTIRALTTLLPLLHRRHLRSVSLPQLFATDPPSVAQVRKGPSACGVAGEPVVGSGG
jgi:peptidoglycan/xylan/chitin deacetylase (PgdA/CDA1 family)